MNILQSNSPNEIFKYIKEELQSNDARMELAEKYYEGDHWCGSGWTTTAGFTVPNSTIENAKSNVKIKAINNLTGKVVDEVADYTLGSERSKAIKTSNEIFNKILYDNNNDELMKQFVKDYLNYDIGVIKQFIDIDTDQIRLSRIDPENVIINRSGLDKSKINWIAINQEIDYETAVSFGFSPMNYAYYYEQKTDGEDEYIYTELWDNQNMTIYINGYQVNQMRNPFNRIPIVTMGDGDCEHSYTRKLTNQQDLINVNLSLELGTNIVNLNPLTLVTLPSNVSITDGDGNVSQEDKSRILNIGAGGIIVMEGPDGNVQRIASEAVTETFVKICEKYVNDFYSQAKIKFLDSDKINAMSGFAIKLVMSSTIKLINSLRSKLTIVYEDLFDCLPNMGEDNITIEWAPTVFENNQDRADLAVKYNAIGLSKEFILKELGYTDEEIALEIARIREEMQFEASLGVKKV